MEWVYPPDWPKQSQHIRAEIKHCNQSLGIQNEMVTGHFGDDCFYLSDGGELSYNWDIVRWMPLPDPPVECGS